MANRDFAPKFVDQIGKSAEHLYNPVPWKLGAMLEVNEATLIIIPFSPTLPKLSHNEVA
jgi:hypothetical protein